MIYTDNRIITNTNRTLGILILLLHFLLKIEHTNLNDEKNMVEAGKNNKNCYHEEKHSLLTFTVE